MNEKLLELAEQAGFTISLGQITIIDFNRYINITLALTKFAELVQANSTSDAEAKWISTNEKLPIEGDIVAILVGSWGNIPYTGYLDGWSWRDADGESIESGFNRVTHWLTLPALKALEKIGLKK